MTDRRPIAPARGRPAGRVDAVSALSVFLLLLVAIPSRLIVGPLGGAGTPAQIVGMMLAASWLVYRASPGTARSRALLPIGMAMLGFVLTLLASYLAAVTRPIEGAELRSADLGMLLAVSWLGITFTAMDAIPTRTRLDVLLGRAVFAAGALATFGLLQYATKQPLTNYLAVPGLRENNALVSIYDRGGLTRPAGTALHPIEFGSVLTMLLPLALHYARTDTLRGPVRRWYPVAALALAIPISISRSAIVSAAVVLLVLVPTWPRAVRRRAYACFLGLGVVVYLVVPGLLGTLTGLFSGISSDSSAQSRTGSYDLAGQFIARAPVFGRGFLTFLPAYRILDNQYLLLLIEAGAVGLLGVLGLLLTGIVGNLGLARRAGTPADRSLAHAFVAAFCSVGVSLALFDGFSFPMAAALLFFLLGCAGAFYRLAATPVEPGIRKARRILASSAGPAGSMSRAGSYAVFDSISAGWIRSPRRSAGPRCALPTRGPDSW